MNVPFEIRGPLTFSSPKYMASTEEAYLRNLENFNKVEKFYSEAQKIEGLTIIPNNENWDMVLSEEKDWEEEDRHYGMYNMFVDQGTGRFNALNIFFAAFSAKSVSYGGSKKTISTFIFSVFNFSKTFS